VKTADLSPPLGWKGGPCKVVDRIEQMVRTPALREDLAEKVEHGQKLTNSEAAKVYSIETDRGGGMFKSVKITPHAQYRMDQRAITVGDLRVALMNYSHQLNDWKSRDSWEWQQFTMDSMRGEPIEWNDKKLGNLRVVFVNDRGTAKIVSTYFVGESDPRPETCGLHPKHAGITTQDMSGYRTFVKDPAPQKSDTGDSKSKSEGKYPTQGLPDPPWSKSKPTRGPTVYNVPGESGSDSSGTIHKDKVRTKGTPGGQYDNGATHPETPYNNTGITPQRRPGMTAEWDSAALADWDEDWGGCDEEMSVEAGMYPPAYPGAKRQRKQKGRAYLYFHKRYVRKRGLAKRRQNRRDKRLRNNGRYKADRQRRKDKPEKFERRPGGGSTTIKQRNDRQRAKEKLTPGKNRKDNRPKRAFESVPFYHFPSGEWGWVDEVSPMGFIHFTMDGVPDAVDFDTFFDEAVVDEDRVDDLFRYMDEVFEYDGTEDSEDPMSDEPDDLFESWLNDGFNKFAISFQVKTRPKERRRKQKGEDKLKAKQRYRQNRMKSRQNSRKRRKQLKHNPAFKRQQQIRRKHPERFKMRLGYVLTAPEIAFVFEAGAELVQGYVRNISGMTGLVQFYLNEQNERLLRSLPVREFLALAAFLSDEDEDAMYALIDAEVGIEAYGDPEEVDSDLVNLYILGSGFMHTRQERDEPGEVDDLLIDPEDDDLFYGMVNKLASQVTADFFREQRPPEMDPDTVYDRANDHDKRKRRDRQPGDPGLNGPYEDEVQHSNPGSRVLPSGAGHVEKSGRMNFTSLPGELRQSLLQLVRSPLWKQYISGGARDKHVLAWLREHGWGDLSVPDMHRLFDQAHEMRLAQGSSRIATLIREIREGCGPEILARSEKLALRLARVDQKNSVWLFDVQGSKKAYRVRLKAARKGNVADMQKLHVKVSCSCPFWQWQGPEFHAKQGDYLYGSPRGLATKPNIKDPNGQHRACKHVLAVLRHVTSNEWSLPKQPRMARYLADTIRLGEMSAEYPEIERHQRMVAARYLASQEVEDA